MKQQEPLNFVKCGADYTLLVECWSMGVKYGQTASTLTDAHNVYIAEDQYTHFCKLMDAMVDIDIGVRQAELGREGV